MKTLRFFILSFLLYSPHLMADYAEECLSEGCNAEEVRELYFSYKEECINEGCSNEEVIELAGGAGSVNAMLSEFRRRGYRVVDNSPGQNCTPTGSRFKCTFLIGVCQDWYFCPGGTDICPPDDPFCPGGNTKSSWYACGVCFGFDW